MGKPLRRNGRYYTRRRIPTDLISAYGRKEIVVALGTADPAEGNRLNRAMWVQLDQQFEDKRAALANVMPEEERQREAAQRQVTALKASPIETRLAAAVDRLRRARATAATNGLDDLSEWTIDRRRDLAWHQSVLDGKEPPEFSAEGHEVGRNALRAVLDGEGPALLAQTTSLPDFAGALTMAELVERWSTAQEPTVKTKNKMLSVVKEVEQMNGPLTTAQLTPHVAQRYKEALEAAGRSKATGNNKLGLFRALCRTALKNRLIASDPCANINITVQRKRGANKARTAFDTASLAAVFGSRVYAQGYRPEGGKGEAAYWLPLLALFTGGRLRELGQLRVKDVLEEPYLDGDEQDARAWTIRFVFDAAEGLRLKNEGSERRVPVHQTLIALGLLRYVDSMRDAGESRLFPQLEPDADGNVTAAWSKWFGRWLRKDCKVTDTRLVFHSFRHTFKHCARYSRIPPDVNNELTGHETGETGDDYGGLSYPLHPLVEGMRQYRVPEFVPPAPPPGLC